MLFVIAQSGYLGFGLTTELHYTELNVIVSLQPLYDQLVQDDKVPNVFTLGLCNGMVSK